MKALEDIQEIAGRVLVLSAEQKPASQIRSARLQLFLLWRAPEFTQYRENLGKLVNEMPGRMPHVTQTNNPYWNHYLATMEQFVRVCEYEDVSSPDFVMEAGMLKTDLEIMAQHEIDVEEAFSRRQ